MKHTMSPDMLTPDGKLKPEVERVAAYREQAKGFYQHKAEQHKRMSERTLQSVAEQEARRLAEQAGREAGTAKLNPPAAIDPNPFRRTLEEARAHTFSFSPRADHRRLKNLETWAKEWDVKHAQEMKAAELAAKLQSDPAYVNARQYAALYEKTVSPEEITSLEFAKGQLAAGDINGFWTSVKESEQRTWARQDEKRAQHKVAVGAVNVELSAAEKAIKESEARLAEISSH